MDLAVLVLLVVLLVFHAVSLWRAFRGAPVYQWSWRVTAAVSSLADWQTGKGQASTELAAEQAADDFVGNLEAEHGADDVAVIHLAVSRVE